MRKKRLFAFSLMVGLSASFITLKINSDIMASAQDAKAPQDGLIGGCSAIDALDKCIQERFSNADKVFGIARVDTSTSHISSFQPVTQEERQVVSELERGGWQVGFYLAGRRVLGPKPENKLLYGGYRGFGGPIMIAPQMPRHSEIRIPTLDDLWERAQKAILSFDSKNQYDFSVGKWSVTARPIRAKESCLKCHNNFNYGNIVPVAHAPSPIPLKVGDTLGVAMYVYTTYAKSNNVKKP